MCGGGSISIEVGGTARAMILSRDIRVLSFYREPVRFLVPFISLAMWMIRLVVNAGIILLPYATQQP